MTDRLINAGPATYVSPLGGVFAAGETVPGSGEDPALARDLAAGRLLAVPSREPASTEVLPPAGPDAEALEAFDAQLNEDGFLPDTEAKKPAPKTSSRPPAKKATASRPTEKE